MIFANGSQDFFGQQGTAINSGGKKNPPFLAGVKILNDFYV
jgi:hypothetical protein